MTPRHEFTRRPLRALCALALTLTAVAVAAPSAGAYVTPAAAEHAADRGAAWFETNQAASGELGSDWAMTAFAAVGLNAADVSTSLADPSAQDYYLGDWQANGPGGAATDAERAILAGVAGGIQTSRLAATADAEKSNLVARVAELFDGTQIGSAGLLNDDIFGILALHRVGAPRPLLREVADHLRATQLPDGGWSWSAGSSFVDVDVTGSAIAALCAAGAGPGDPDVQEALALLHANQDPATGGFVAPAPFGIGVNTDTTAWAASGLVQCGIDPQGPEWTTAQGKTPLDYLVAMQKPDGHFAWTADYDGGSFETYSAVRPLAGVAFSTAPPARLDGTSPAVRPVADVASGTTVPITLAIDHGAAAADVRMCRVDVASGSDLGQVLGDAEAASTPAGCVAGFATGGGELTSLNGVVAGDGREWQVKVDGTAANADEPIGFGDLVFLQYAATVADPGPAPKVAVPPLGQPPKQKRRGPRVGLRRGVGWEAQSVAVGLRCPRGLGETGCRGTVSVRFRQPGNGALALGGAAAFQLASGSRRTVAVPASSALQAALRDRGRLKLRLTAFTRGEDSSVRITHGKRFLAG